jgi:hypothetical protein
MPGIVQYAALWLYPVQILAVLWTVLLRPIVVFLSLSRHAGRALNRPRLNPSKSLPTIRHRRRVLKVDEKGLGLIIYA